MPVYILREGQFNIFKIGRTNGDIESVIRRLRTGNSQPLSLFHLIETDQESVCEAFFHRMLASRRVVRGGGWEFFEIESEEMNRVIADFRQMLEDLEGARLAVQDLGKQHCTDVLLEPNSEDQKLLERLMKIKEEQEYLVIERELIESKLKQRIGTASGLRGLATWKTQLTRRYDEKLFRDSAPDMYNELLERYYCLDTTAWKRERPDEYKSVQTTFYSPYVSRVFKLQKMD